MKPLSQMTREELWALDDSKIDELVQKHKAFVIGVDTASGKLWIPKTKGELIMCLEQRRLSLQQSAADARRDTQQER